MGLTRRGYTGGPPPLCIKGPPIGPPPPPDAPAHTLNIFTHWFQYPPWDPWDSIDIWLLHYAGPPLQYQGQLQTRGHDLSATFTYVDWSKTWELHIINFTPPDTSLTSHWDTVHVDPTKPFTTPLLR
ncbi:unnamed protein product, partial [marine sediment metagenome]